MSRQSNAALLLCIVLGLAGCVSPVKHEAGVHGAGTEIRPPNIVIFYADDLGYGDIGVMEGGAPDVLTPNIDALAMSGVLMTNFYANHPTCSPSRAALLTGQYPHRSGFENNVSALNPDAMSFGLSSDVPTIAERLSELGYATGMFGKWHVGHSPDNHPTERGFETFFGSLLGAMAFTRDGVAGAKTVQRGTAVEPMPRHLTPAFADEAIDFIGSEKDGPFFLYLPFFAVHAPLQSTDDYLGRVPDVGEANRRTYLAMLLAMDDAIGRVVAALEGHGLREQTLIVFSSDNGGPTWQTTSSNAPLNGVKVLLLEGGIRVPTIFNWPGRIPAGERNGAMAMGVDITATALSAAGADIVGDELDGVDLVPYLNGAQGGMPHEAIFWRSSSQGQSAVRQGSWKYLRIGEKEYLFDLSKDLGERNNLAVEYPQRVEAMRLAFEGWEREMSAPRWGRTQEQLVQSGLLSNMVALVDGYVEGADVDPRSILYGGGPEEPQSSSAAE